MELKDYQQQALDTLDRYLDALDDARQQVDRIPHEVLRELPADSRRQLEDYASRTWNNLRNASVLPGVTNSRGQIEIPDHIPRTSNSDKPIPHVCLKIPTGGGKTLLGVEAVRHLKLGTGFVLWLVPTKAIYQQTWDAFRNKEHPYRQILERASGGRVKLLEKDNLFTKQDIENHLCVMLLMLPAANRNRNKEFLKIFRDTGGYATFFPIEDDVREHKALSEMYPDLETAVVDQPVQPRLAVNPADSLIKQSLFNVLKLLRPVVILDEAHKAYGSRTAENNHEFVKSVNRINPRFVLELSATPKLGISNILVNVSGTDLQREEMIKLPIELRDFPNSGWKETLAKTKRARDRLEEIAMQAQEVENSYIRPIAVIRVDRTGKNQRDGTRVHALDARDELINVLGVPEEQVKVKSSDQDELTGINLMEDTCPVRYIITKDALKEGWDCPFAYLLALLDNTTAQTAMTQMLGRVMRQPYARLTTFPELNKCYIFCYNQDVRSSVEKIKNGLEAEGLTGLADATVQSVSDQSTERRTICRREEYRDVEIYLPRVLHQHGDNWRSLSYERDILGVIRWNEIGEVETVPLGDEAQIQETRSTIHLQDETELEKKFQESATDTLDVGFFVRRLTDIIPNPWCAARIVKRIFAAYRENGTDDGTLYEQRLYITEYLKNCLRQRVETLAEAIFQDKLDNDRIRFRLETDIALNYQLAKTLEVNLARGAKQLRDSFDDPLNRNLFNPVYEGEFNTLEKDFALYIDGQSAVKWWHRIAVKQDCFLQGWRRDRIYPDFLACLQRRADIPQRLIIFETKGQHLSGNSDTSYKEKLLEMLEKAYENATDCGTMTAVAPDGQSMLFRILLENTWRETANATLAES